MDSKKLFNRSRKIFPAGVNSPVRYYPPYPIFISHGKGSKIYSVDGKSYVDYCLAYGPLILGHSPREIKEKLNEQLEKGWIYGAPTELEVKYGEMISKYTGIEMMRFTSSGTEATMHAIRLGRAYTGRKKIVKMKGGFHGSHDYVLVSSGSGAVGIPSSPGIPDETSKFTMLTEYNDFQSIEKIFRENGNEIALIITEPVLGNIGVIPPENEYLKFLREITEKYDSLLIMDEVITGFRLHFGTASQYDKVKPDLIILGKIIGGGLPFALFGGRKDIMEMISPLGKVYQAGTYSGNPLSVTAGIATLNSLKTKDYNLFYEYLKIIEKYVNDAKEDFNSKVVLNGLGGMFQIFFNDIVRNNEEAMKSDSKTYFELFKHFLKKSIYVPPSQFESLFFSFKHKKNEINKLGMTIYEFLRENKNRI